jgi:hypothetical protein
MGLGRWDQELLRNTKESGPSAIHVIAHTLSDNFDGDQVGDAYLFWRLRQLGDPDRAQPLLRLSGNLSAMRTCEVALTDAGQSVLDGRANAVELNGIDEWVLGVHVSSKSGTVVYQSDGAIIEA